jgi:hypothetical protein
LITMGFNQSRAGSGFVAGQIYSGHKNSSY